MKLLKAVKPAVAGHVLVEVVVNFALPYAIYAYWQPTLGDVRALIASSVPPVLWSITELVRRRRVDAISLLVIAGIVLGLVAMAGGGSAKFLQLRENLVTGLIGIVFLGSALIGKPLIFQLARATMSRESSEKAAEFDNLQKYAGFRHTMSFLTIFWGVGLIVQTAVACALVYTLTIRNYLIVSPIVGYGFTGALVLFTVVYSRRARKKGERARAASAGTTSGV